MNPDHSIFYKNRYTLRLLNFLCYRNNFIHTCRYSNDDVNISYHVVDYNKFKFSLNDWNNYQLASLLQRPYHVLVSDESLEEARDRNIMNTVKTIKRIFY
jgi:hypothetical protein